MTDHEPISVTVVDDDARLAELLGIYLQEMSCRPRIFTDPVLALAELEKEPPDIVVADLMMPEVDGLTILKKVKARDPQTDVIIISGHADKRSALQALKLGAFDLLEKPFEKDELLETIKRTMRYREVVKERDTIKEQLSFLSQREAEQWGIQALVGRSEAAQTIIHHIRLLQKAPTKAILITGENGTGKELVARSIHFGSAKAKRPFVPVNCAAVPLELAESTLFGHVRGSFTGAISDKKGAFEIADGGTLFLDEVGDTPYAVQTKMLRVLEDGVVERVGQTGGGRQVDIRVIAATNADMDARLAAGTFRTDLYHRLAAFTIQVLPLRERREDIPLLLRHFARIFSREMGFPEPFLDPEMMKTLQEYSFPGNVRELKNMVERALIETGGKEIRLNNLYFQKISRAAVVEGTGASPDSDVPFNLREAELVLIRRALTQTHGNASAAAKLLGISRAKLYRSLPSVSK